MNNVIGVSFAKRIEYSSSVRFGKRTQIVGDCVFARHFAVFFVDTSLKSYVSKISLIND